MQFTNSWLRPLNSMADIFVENLNNLSIIRVSGVLTFDEFVSAVKEYYPYVTCNIIWDFSDSNLDDITTTQLMKLPTIAKMYMIQRVSGKTAFVSPHTCTHRLLKTYVVIAELSGIRFKSDVFIRLDEALQWL